MIGNSGKASAGAAVSEAARCIVAAGRKLFCDEPTSKLGPLKATVCPNAAELARNVDLLVVFGGDGTMLRVAREIAGLRTPVLGINIGALGFLTAVPSEETAAALKQVWAGEFTFEHRALLKAAGSCGGRGVVQAALNDVVISRGGASRLIELSVHVDDEALTRYRCDGLIISTPTGSTAYSLAAGGAVVFPTARVLALTPICPHTLSNRALILPETAKIKVEVISENPATILSADGETISEMTAGDCVNIRQSRQSVRLLRLAGTSFSETLRRKLHWRGTPL